MAPQAGVHLEIAFHVAAVIAVVPEIQRKRRDRQGTHQFAHLIGQGAASVVEGVDGDSKAAALHFTRVLRQDRTGADKRRGGIGTTGDRCQQQVAVHVVVNPLIALDRQRRAGGSERADARDVTRRARLHAGLHALCDIGGAGAKHIGFGARGQVPQPAHVRRGGIAVVLDDGAARQHGVDHQVPDDPVGR